MNKKTTKLCTVLLIMLLMLLPMTAYADGGSRSEETLSNLESLMYSADSTGIINMLGVNLFEEGIDQVIFQTNQFVSDATFIGKQGPFWWILQMCMGLGALFSIIVAGGMAYRMMLKGEPFDPMKILRILGIATVMLFWYPGEVFTGTNGCILDLLSYIPNALGSYTHELYNLEAEQVGKKFRDSVRAMDKENQEYLKAKGTYATSVKQVASGNTSTTGTVENGFDILSDAGSGGTHASDLFPVTDPGTPHATGTSGGTSSTASSPGSAGTAESTAVQAETMMTWAGIMLCLDKLLLFLAILLFRIGWWGMIFCQQVILGMLTIFGPIQWAFSVLPKWEGAWAKWLIRYLTVHLYGAMMYFVGFYVLLLFDIVLSIQLNDLNNVVSSGSGILHNGMLTAGYLVVASIVALKCLNLVPDLATWMIPEGESSFSTRNFGEGVATEVNSKGMGIGKAFIH